MLDPFEDPRDMDPANWDCCDEHQTVFRKGDECPKCEPEPVAPLFVRCGKPVADGDGIGTCCNELGHEGPCDDFPF